MGLYCFSFVAEGGGRVSARRPRYLFFASPKKSTQKKGDPAVRVPSLRCGQPAMLEAGVHRGTRCVPPSGELRSNIRGESVHHARALRHALTPASALLGTSRRDWGPHTGHRFARPDLPRCAWPGQSARASCVGSAQRVTDIRRSCQGSSRVVPAPHPFWLRGLGVAFSLVTFSWRRKRKLLRRRADIPAPALRSSKQSPSAPYCPV